MGVNSDVVKSDVEYFIDGTVFVTHYDMMKYENHRYMIWRDGGLVSFIIPEEMYNELNK